ncbi:hypothetical protein [Nocardioides marmotae]|uniref:hypothetical protein n=1 Tax=Nocardioides marmotae TaxID=2663857 RepID=UPI0012B64FA9|nr:hypothetical protein [Nocardioides marmotae]MBC9734398.1 hypothetical protein [Nocardioides marmotae]MTB85498.1 hypothetical protein [Nocardioides marmotae]
MSESNPEQVENEADEYAPEEPESPDTGTVYEGATGEPAATPNDETPDEEEPA